GVQVRCGQTSGFGGPGAEALQAVAFGASPGGLVAAVGLLVAFEVSEVAGEGDLDERGASSLPGAGDGLTGGFVHGEEVEAVDDDAGHAEAGGAVGDVVRGHRPRARGGFAVAVVL